MIIIVCVFFHFPIFIKPTNRSSRPWIGSVQNFFIRSDRLERNPKPNNFRFGSKIEAQTDLNRDCPLKLPLPALSVLSFPVLPAPARKNEQVRTSVFKFKCFLSFLSLIE